MKAKQLFLTCLLAIVGSMAGQKAFAYDAKIGGIYYNFSPSGATVTYQYQNYDGSFLSDYSGAIVIPKTVTYYGQTFSVTSIGSYAFSGCSSLTSITIPNSVTSIDYNAFEGCSSLTSINIPNSVTSIGYVAFYNCSSLTSVTIPESVTSIGGWAFEYCSSLTSVTIPNSVTSIDYEAFRYCSSLTDVWCYAENVPTTDSNAFENSPIASATLHVPEGSIEAYSTTAPWSNFGNIVAIDETHRIIEDLSELSNNKQYLIHTRDKIRGSLGVINNHLASNNPTVTGPYDCRPVVLDTDNPLITSVNQLSSPNTEPTEGSLADMIDGNSNTYWHSTWSDGDVENGTHYFQVEMVSQDDIDVAFQVTRRKHDNNHITEWGVYGTNDADDSKENCEQLAVIKTPYNNWGETRVSDIFSTGGYQYLRFYINDTSTPHGFGHLAEFQLYPATFDETRDASPFAIIQKNDGYYLYSVHDKAFITPDNDGDESVHPLLPSDNKMNIYKRDNHFVFDFIDTGYTINVNYDPGIAICDYGTLTDRFDDGNLFTIEEVGDFDPTEALAKFATQITVTYKVMYEENVVATATREVTSGSALPPVPASLDNGFVTLTKTGTHPTTVTGDVTVTYNATWNGPFEFTKTAESAKWYNMHIRSGYYVGKQDTEPYYPTRNVDEDMLATPAYQWAFGGDPYHVKVYNRTTGLDETLTKDGDDAVMRSGNYTWDILSNNGGFVLRVTGTDYSCINQFGSNSGPLQFWTNSKSLTDDGSTFRVEEVIETSPAIEFADANVKALCVANWDSNGDSELSEEEAAAVTNLGEVFKYQTNITSFNELQYFTGLTSIGEYAFTNCLRLTSITIPESVTTIEKYAFWNCSSLVSATIPNSVTSINASAFRSCRSLNSINIPNSVTSIDRYVFSECSGLTSVTIPNSVTSIGYGAFSECSGLTSFTIPNSVTSIDGYAFGSCSSLTSITIPNSVTSIGVKVIGGCISLTSIKVEESNSKYNSHDKCNAIIETATNTLIAGCKNTTIPNSVTSIGESAFEGCSNLTSITIPNSVTSIGFAAFMDCSGLTSITIPNSVTSIDGYAFGSCSSLTSITLPESLTSIGYLAFMDCSGLTDVWCYAASVPMTTGNDVFDFSLSSTTLHVPAVSFIAYSTTAPWSSFGTIIPIDGFVINDETTSFSIAVEESGKAVVHTHQFTGDWEALYLPFAIDYDAIRADFDLAEIDGVVQNDDNNDGIADITVLSIMGFKEQMTEPNTPYLIRAKNAGEQTIVFDDVTVYPTEAATFECSSFSKRYEFTGSYNTLGASALANRYVVQGGELVKGASSLAPCRWYMTAISKTGGALNLPARIRIMPVEDVITGSPLLTSPEEEGQVYNLAGQRLNKVQKGINIVGGKKILIK